MNPDQSKQEKRSYCRLCHGLCGMVVTVEGGRITAVRGDRDNPVTRGYACIKGLQAPELHHGPRRLRAHHVRAADGTHVPVALDKALDDVAAKLSGIVERHGPAAVACFAGTQWAYNVLLRLMGPAFMAALGSPSVFTTMTIDQSAKWVTASRLGVFQSGRHDFPTSDVWLLSGVNPMVSLAGPSAGMPPYDPVKVIKDARARGLKLIVIDPVETQTAKNADLFLQPIPGEDPTLFAALIHVVLREGWHDAAFCDRYVKDLDALREAVAPFDEAYASTRAGVPAEQIRQAAAMFARDGSRGCAGGGTGPNMAPRSNLAEHLIECLNVVCGRYRREGEAVANSGVMYPRPTLRAEVTAPTRTWESGPRSRSGHGTLQGTMMSGILADEILHPGDDRVRALLVMGANPANALPGQAHAVEALKSLDLLVTSDAIWSHTARLADYVFAANQPFERPDTTFSGEQRLPRPYAQYTPAIIDPEPGMDVVDDWYVYYALAQRMGLQIRWAGRDLDMHNTPTSDDLLALLAQDGQVPFAEVRKHPSGAIFDVPPVIVAPAREGAEGRFDVAPDDVRAELKAVLQERPSVARAARDDLPCTHLMVPRREREMINTYGRDLSATRKRFPRNPAYLHPDDLASLGLTSGQRVEIHAEAGSIEAVVEADTAVRPGVVSMTHGWGGLPGDGDTYEAVGASTCRLVALDRAVEPINAMPRLSAIPVAITAI